MSKIGKDVLKDCQRSEAQRRSKWCMLYLVIWYSIWLTAIFTIPNWYGRILIILVGLLIHDRISIHLLAWIEEAKGKTQNKERGE